MKQLCLALSLVLLPHALAAQDTTAAAAPEGPRPCAVSLAGEDLAGWREVRATGFTFCVPANWRPTGGRSRDGADARTWRGGSGSITWGTGQYRAELVSTVVTTVTIGGVDASAPAPANRSRSFSELIGGSMANLWDNEVDGVRFTGATWSSPRAIHISGKNRDARTAAVQLRVYRSVRFTQP